jgi:hypothetical protein
VPSLTRGWVCSFKLLLGLTGEQSFSGLSPTGHITIFYCLNFLDSPNLKCQVHVSSQSQSHITTHNQSASRLGVRQPSGTRDQFFFLLQILFRQLWVCYFVSPSLTRGQVCNFLLLLVLASAVPLGSAFCQHQFIVSHYVHKVFT